MSKEPLQAALQQAPSAIKTVLAIFIVLVLGLGGYLYYAHAEFSKERAANASSTLVLNERIAGLEGELAQARDDNDELSDDLRAEKRRNDRFSDQIEELSGTVSLLDKLRQTDSELLKKYSKVAFLNENYSPKSLVDIDKDFLSSSATNQQILTQVAPYLEDMLAEAKEDGVDIRVLSAYRSFGTQSALKTQYKVIYGSGANQFSADQGYSEHQLGTTVDLNTPTMASTLDGFDQTTAYQWLLKNAYKYGFVLSYPSGNAYYQFEPWHWRFVGIDLARDLQRAGKYFYDLDQREIDAYLVKIFD